MHKQSIFRATEFTFNVCIPVFKTNLYIHCTCIIFLNTQLYTFVKTVFVVNFIKGFVTIFKIQVILLTVDLYSPHQKQRKCTHSPMINVHKRKNKQYIICIQKAMHSSAKSQFPPLSVLFICSCDNVHYKQERRFLLYLLS